MNAFSAKYVIQLTLRNMLKAVDRSIAITTTRISDDDSSEVLLCLKQLNEIRGSINCLLNR